MEFQIGDKIKTKKNHPCGSNEWEITRVGLDFKLKCLRMSDIVLWFQEKRH